MITDYGRQLAEQGVDKLKRELTAHGGPYAGLLTDEGVEVVQPGSGLLRKAVTGGIGPDMHARWEVEAAADGILLHAIGLAARPDGPFLAKLFLAPGDPAGVIEAWIGYTIELDGPLDITIS